MEILKPRVQRVVWSGRDLASSPLVLALLLVLVTASALGVVYSSYQSRQLFNALQQQYRESLSLDEEWGRLLLEQSTWAAHDRIGQLAIGKLGMVRAEAAAIVVVTE